jgi:acyl dehydratase
MSATATGWPERIALRVGPVSAVDLALFAAASGDHNPLHLDPEVARAAGFERPLVHGMLTMAFAGRVITQHVGAGCVRRLQTRFTGVVMVGETLELAATLSAVEPTHAVYALRVTTADGRAVASGEAEVPGPARGRAAAARPEAPDDTQAGAPA